MPASSTRAVTEATIDTVLALLYDVIGCPDEVDEATACVRRATWSTAPQWRRSAPSDAPRAGGGSRRTAGRVATAPWRCGRRTCRAARGSRPRRRRPPSRSARTTTRRTDRSPRARPGRRRARPGAATCASGGKSFADLVVDRPGSRGRTDRHRRGRRASPPSTRGDRRAGAGHAALRSRIAGSTQCHAVAAKTRSNRVPAGGAHVSKSAWMTSTFGNPARFRRAAATSSTTELEAGDLDAARRERARRLPRRAADLEHAFTGAQPGEADQLVVQVVGVVGSGPLVAVGGGVERRAEALTIVSHEITRSVSSGESPSSGWPPVMIGWQLPSPTPPPTGSVTRMTVSRIWCSRRAFSGVRAVGDVLPVDVVLAAPFAVVVAVEAEVQAGAELDAGLVEHLDDQLAGHAVAGRRPDHAAAQAPVRGVVGQLGREVEPRLVRAVRVLDPTHHDLVHDAEAGRGDDLEVHEHPVAGAVVALEQQRAPDHLEAETRERVDLGHVGRRHADAVAHAPRVVTGRDAVRGRELGAVPVDLHPAGADADLVVADEVGRRAEPVLVHGAVLERGRQRGLERPLERDRQHVVRVEREPHDAQRLEHLVAQRRDGGALGIGRERATRAHGPLARPSRHRAVPVDHVAVRVLPHAEAELDRPVARHRHRADLLGPRGIARTDRRRTCRRPGGETLRRRRRSGRSGCSSFDGVPVRAVEQRARANAGA